MRLRSEVIGALNLFEAEPATYGQEKLRVGQALADIATVGLLQQRAIHTRDVLTNNSRLHSTAGCWSSRRKVCWPSGCRSM
ncbi:hypothetical protein [Paractinoplanes hotanensis]|uniref:Uncharacterized protein n=1 Tax=Paractinoplanes hotanensis TaxID=2906497 RepID=A0ABT0YBH7_9ACTN|nr:hypothetical protein [Actinoplanes hotanensis]MCM4083409.1 hypothetical protein [Actinoplanes hotanensis]